MNCARRGRTFHELHGSCAPVCTQADARWRLPDGVLVDVYHRLKDDLSHNPADQMRRTTYPFDGMTYTFPAVDRSNRVYGYVFQFQIKYGMDEESLWVVRGAYFRISFS